LEQLWVQILIDDLELWLMFFTFTQIKKRKRPLKIREKSSFKPSLKKGRETIQQKSKVSMKPSSMMKSS